MIVCMWSWIWLKREEEVNSNKSSVWIKRRNGEERRKLNVCAEGIPCANTKKPIIPTNPMKQARPSTTIHILCTCTIILSKSLHFHYPLLHTLIFSLTWAARTPPRFHAECPMRESIFFFFSYCLPRRSCILVYTIVCIWTLTWFSWNYKIFGRMWNVGLFWNLIWCRYIYWWCSWNIYIYSDVIIWNKLSWVESSRDTIN